MIMRFIFALFIAIPILEMVVLIQVGQQIGALWTIVLVLLTDFHNKHNYWFIVYLALWYVVLTWLLVSLSSVIGIEPMILAFVMLGNWNRSMPLA